MDVLLCVWLGVVLEVRIAGASRRGVGVWWLRWGEALRLLSWRLRSHCS